MVPGKIDENLITELINKDQRRLATGCCCEESTYSILKIFIEKIFTSGFEGKRFYFAYINIIIKDF